MIDTYCTTRTCDPNIIGKGRHKITAREDAPNDEGRKIKKPQKRNHKTVIFNNLNIKITLVKAKIGLNC